MNLKQLRIIEILWIKTISCFLVVICLISFGVISSVYAATPTKTPTKAPIDVEKLLNDPNTQVVVRDATYSATIAVTPTIAPVSTNQITLSSPSEGSIQVDTNLIFSGKAPADTLITINIHDNDWTDKSIKQSSLLDILGTTTSDKNGRWLYSPTIKLELGKYSVWAYYTDSQEGNLQSLPVYFTVINTLGKTQNVVFWRSIQFWIFTCLIVVGIGIISFFLKRKSILPFPFGQKRKKENIDVTCDINKNNVVTEKNTVSENNDLENSNFSTQQNKYDQLKRLEELSKEISDVKETLITTAENIASVGQATEENEKSVNKEIELNEQPTQPVVPVQAPTPIVVPPTVVTPIVTPVTQPQPVVTPVVSTPPVVTPVEATPVVPTQAPTPIVAPPTVVTPIVTPVTQPQPVVTPVVPTPVVPTQPVVTPTAPIAPTSVTVPNPTVISEIIKTN